MVAEGFQTFYVCENNQSGAYFRKYALKSAWDFSEKEQKRAKYLKI